MEYKDNLEALLEISDNSIIVEQGSFEIKGLTQVDSKISMIEEYLSTIVLETEDDVKDAKKLVARIRKEADALNKERIEAEKKYLEPVQPVKNYVKQIRDKATQAEEHLRVQIRDWEEKERDKKEEKLRKIFEKRKRPYEFSEFLEFDKFLQPRHLNKSETINKVEQEMVAFFEEKKQDIEVIKSTYPDDFDEVFAIYTSHGGMNVGSTILYYNELHKKQEEIRQVREPDTNPEEIKSNTNETWLSIYIQEEDFERVKQLLEVAGIKYK